MGTEHDSKNNPSDNPVGADGNGGEDLVGDGGFTSSDDENGMESDSDSDFSSGAGSDPDSDDGEENVGGGGGTSKAAETRKEEDEVDEDDPVVKAIIQAKAKKSFNHPPDLVLEGIPSTLSFHPVEDRILFGNYDGQLLLYSYSVDGNLKLTQVQHKDTSTRVVTFSHDGQKLISAFSDQTLKFYDVENGLQLERTIKNATSAPVSSLFVIDENLLATGDDDGNMLLWDKRSQNATTSLRLGEDAITSMVSNDEKKVLVCTSEEGAIYAVKIRAGKVQVESEIYDYEFNCSCVFKQESKLAVGDGKGDVYIFNWDEFGKHSDICTGIGRGEAIQAMIPITERIILCGGDDGFIRAFHFFPQTYLGVVGKLSYPVEKMDVCNDGHLIASLGADETIKFWNVSYFENTTVPTGNNSKKENKEKTGKGAHRGTVERQDLSRHNLPSSSHQNASDFFSGLAD